MGTLLVEREGEGDCFLTALLRLIRPQTPSSSRLSLTPSPPPHLLIFSFLLLTICDERCSGRGCCYGGLRFLGCVSSTAIFRQRVCRRVCEAQLGGVCMLSERGTVSVQH